MGCCGCGLVRLSFHAFRLIQAACALLGAGSACIVLLALSGCASTPPTQPRPTPSHVSQNRPAAIPAADNDDGYVVQRGDTLSSIARRNRISLGALIRANHLTNRNHIEVGQKLLIPSSPSSQRRRTSTSRAAAPISPSEIVVDTTPLPGGVQWRWPADGPVLQRYNPNEGSKGIDIGGSLDAPVRSAAAGEVVYAGKGVTGYPGLVIIRHNTQYMTAYANNRAIRVRMGEQVASGQTIGGMGNGRQGKPALHFEIRLRGKAVDPLRLLPKRH